MKIHEVVERQHLYRRKDGSIGYRTISIDEQIDMLKSIGWKPVDDIDENLLKCEDGYWVRTIPYETEDRISYKYLLVKDLTKVKMEIKRLKIQLSESDYKVIKCYEALLSDTPLPYDITQLHTERQSCRDKINELELLLLKD